MKNLFFVIIFSFLSNSIFSQTDSLIIFTKKNCSNCTFVKKQFSGNSINYVEFKLEQRENADLMLNKLSEIGYKDKILLPVIFLNENIYHPVIYSDSSLKRISVINAVDSLLLKNKNGELNLVFSLDGENERDTLKQSDIEGCEVDISPIYLIRKNYKLENDAINYMKELKQEGYINAGVLEYKNYFRVYTNIFFDQNKANVELTKIRKENKMGYLLEVD